MFISLSLVYFYFLSCKSLPTTCKGFSFTTDKRTDRPVVIHVLHIYNVLEKLNVIVLSCTESIILWSVVEFDDFWCQIYCCYSHIRV